MGQENTESTENISVLIGEAQLILAEKRTSLAVLRSGVAVLALPITVLSFLIATSKYYDFFNVLHFVIPLFCILGALTVIGVYLIARSVIRMQHYDKLLKNIKRKNHTISELID
ncbi:hypothetical protein [Desulfatibacillum aliphaticivorans]|uniref:hypothetical protein n=1 Tax=Desulfatibacillum aliphaticivorans TaxID=218208 RepID=UPI00041CC12B|nr:hypothetical protein [Desulfatibacillum aliphaticivorans]